MANKPISMSKLRQLFKLYAQGKSKVGISEITGMSRNTVKKYLKVFFRLKLTLSDIELLSNQELEALFNKEQSTTPPDHIVKLFKFFPEVDKRLKQRGMTLLKLFAEYSLLHPEGLKKSSFNHYYTLWKQRVDPTMHMQHKAGDKLFIDFAGEKLKIVDKETGELRPVEVFVAILGASQYTYVEAVESQSTEDLITVCENALHYYGGAPAAIVPDNLKAAVIKSSKYEPQINENFSGFASHYSMAVIPTRAYKPKDKALVEGAVKIAYNRIYTNLPSEPLGSIVELNKVIQELLDRHNDTLFKGRNYSRKEQFEEMERSELQELPPKRYELRNSLQLTVMKNGHIFIQADKHYYSVPYGHIGRKVKVLYSKSLIEIYYRYELIASHDRVRSPYNYTTEPSHLATQHQYLSDWSPEYFLNQARSIHPDVEYYISQVLIKKKHPEQAYKSCQGILSFSRRVGEKRLVKACQRAHGYGLYQYGIIETILAKKLDTLDDHELSLQMPVHENIRGGSYYQ